MKKKSMSVSQSLGELTFWAKSKVSRIFGSQVRKWQACSIAETKRDDSVFYQEEKVKGFSLPFLKKIYLMLCSHKNKLEVVSTVFLPSNKFKVCLTPVIMTIIYYGLKKKELKTVRDSFSTLLLCRSTEL